MFLVLCSDELLERPVVKIWIASAHYFIIKIILKSEIMLINILEIFRIIPFFKSLYFLSDLFLFSLINQIFDTHDKPNRYTCHPNKPKRNSYYRL